MITWIKYLIDLWKLNRVLRQRVKKYTVYVSGPGRWIVEVDENGNITTRIVV